MQVYILRNEDGTQSVSRKLNDLDKIIGLWKVKSVKYQFIQSIVSELKYEGNPSLEEIVKRKQAYLFTFALNNILRKSRVNMSKDRLYIAIIKQMASMDKKNNYITIPSIIKHFEQTNTPIDRQILLDMVQSKLLYKSYHKVMIIKKGFDLINEKFNN